MFSCCGMKGVDFSVLVTSVPLHHTDLMFLSGYNCPHYSLLRYCIYKTFLSFDSLLRSFEVLWNCFFFLWKYNFLCKYFNYFLRNNKILNYKLPNEMVLVTRNSSWVYLCDSTNLLWNKWSSQRPLSRPMRSETELKDVLKTRWKRASVYLNSAHLYSLRELYTSDPRLHQNYSSTQPSYYK